MSFEQTRQKADRLRAVPLASVLRLSGARPDRRDKNKWHTARGILSIQGAKFINWNLASGGGGAIDLVIHLHRRGFKEALEWLEKTFPEQLLLQQAEAEASPQASLKLPAPDPARLGHVRTYLLTQRALTPALVDPLFDSGTLYADQRSNAVFLLLATDSTLPVGAELRSTTSASWRGMAPGSRKDLGFFSIPPATAQMGPPPIILCESAIDAISCFALHPGHRCVSTSGARPNPAWLPSLLAQSPAVSCGFDADDTGERMARAMIAFHPAVKRLRPSRHDWNKQLTSQP